MYKQKEENFQIIFLLIYQWPVVINNELIMNYYK